VRRINRAKWYAIPELNGEVGIDELHADFLSTCLKVEKKGKISLWKIESDDDLDEVIVAVTIEKSDSFGKLDFIKITPEELNEIGLTPENIPQGMTGYKDNHFELKDLNYKKIGDIAGIILGNLEAEDRYIRKPERAMKNAYLSKMESGEINAAMNPMLIGKL
jgi:hypothetical protein